jgi:hypothetical protein
MLELFRTTTTVEHIIRRKPISFSKFAKDYAEVLNRAHVFCIVTLAWGILLFTHLLSFFSQTILYSCLTFYQYSIVFLWNYLLHPLLLGWHEYQSKSYNNSHFLTLNQVYLSLLIQILYLQQQDNSFLKPN